MSQEAAIHAALATVKDPELHRTLPELGMVKSVSVTSGIAQLEIYLTIAGCPMKDQDRKSTRLNSSHT